MTKTKQTKLKNFDKEMLGILYDECNKMFPVLYKEI